MATSAAKLPTCDSNQVGQLFYVLDDEKFQFCSSEGYQSIDLNGDSGADGKNGANGKDGTNGKDGSSCSVIENTNGSKTILCEDGSSATVNDGADGSSCTISDDNAGTLTQTCTDGTSASWPKALCGTKPYDPATHFCEAGTVLEFCGDLTYDPTTHFCNEGTVLDLCGGLTYDPAMELCEAGTVMKFCGDLTYDPMTHFCDEETTTPMLSWLAHCLVPGNCGTFSDSRETPAKQYKWTKIGTQTWMAENQTHRLPRPSTMYTITMVKVWQQLRLAATTQTMECCTTGQQLWLLALQAGICPALGILQRYIQMWVESKRLVPN